MQSKQGIAKFGILNQMGLFARGRPIYQFYRITGTNSCFMELSLSGKSMLIVAESDIYHLTVVVGRNAWFDLLSLSEYFNLSL